MILKTDAMCKSGQRKTGTAQIRENLALFVSGNPETFLRTLRRTVAILDSCSKLGLQDGSWHFATILHNSARSLRDRLAILETEPQEVRMPATNAATEYTNAENTQVAGLVTKSYPAPDLRSEQRR